MTDREIFRFMNTRPAQRTADQSNVVRLYEGARETTALRRRLEDAKSVGDRKRMTDIADDFINSPLFVARLSSLTTPLARLDAWLLEHRGATAEALGLAVKDIFGQTAEEVVRRDDFLEDWRRVADSLLAVNVSRKPRMPYYDELVRAARLCRLIERLAMADARLRRRGGVQVALTAPVLLPASLLALPSERRNGGDRAAPDGDGNDEKVRRRLVQLFQLESAIAELVTLHEADVTRLEAAESEERRPARALPVREPGEATSGVRRREVEAARGMLGGDHPSVLGVAAAATLSPQTKAVLRELRQPPDSIHVPRAVRELETALGNLASDLFLPQSGTRNVTIGKLMLPGAMITKPGPLLPVAGIKDIALPPLVGALLPWPTPHATTPSVPSGAGAIKPAGIADLMLVRQDIKKYELGEVAHVENTLQGESKERTHRRAQTTEETVLTEAERTESIERDLQSTERFELRTESGETLKENLKLEAGVTVTAKYGPSVEVKANAGFTYERAREESNKTASAYARDVVSKAVSRLQERVLERRTRRTVEEIEETNKHAIDNSGGPGHVIGVYRWVDKLYKAQVLNYGRRLLLEFVVPEPAAFYRYSRAARPIEGVTMERPDPPGFTVGGTFIPLQPTNMTLTQYLYWVGKYNVEGVEPPPSMYTMIGVSLEQPYSDKGHPFTKTSTELKVPAGYRARSAAVAWNATHYDGWWLGLIVGSKSRLLHLQENSAYLSDENDAVPLSLHSNEVLAAVINVEVECSRSDEAYRTWQIKTFNTVMTAYQRLKSKYDEQVAAAQVQQGVAIAGRNPLSNREIERTELKKAAISLFTAQNFDLFDAVEGDVPPFGYPEMKFAETAAEGPYIQFFEQSMEWANMTYVFYPYFWGRKADWDIVSQLDDVEPLFGRFLQAGAARVQVPVRPGFEDAVLYFLEAGGTIWNGGDPPHIDDELYVSLIKEIREQTGEDFTAGEGTLEVTQGSRDVVGTGTSFTAADLDREIRLAGGVYAIRAVTSATEIALDRAYVAPSDAALPYSVGAKLVGEPWDVRLPTSLVILQQDATLPEWTTV